MCINIQCMMYVFMFAEFAIFSTRFFCCNEEEQRHFIVKTQTDGVIIKLIVQKRKRDEI